MQTFGDYLKRQREDRNISLREVAHLTMITERYLDSLEKDDYAKLPEGPYIRGYISSYATSIGIDANEALNRFDALCGEGNKPKDIQQEISEDKKRQSSVAFLSNKRDWFFLCFIILTLAAFGLYQLLPQSQKKANVAAILTGLKDKGLSETPPVKTDDDVSSLSPNDYLSSSGKPGRFENGMANRDNKGTLDPPSSQKVPSPPAQKPPRLMEPSSLPSENPAKVPTQMANVQGMDTKYQRASKVEDPASGTHPPLEHPISAQIISGEKTNVQYSETPRPANPFLRVATGEQIGGLRANYKNNIEVLKVAACSDVKDKVPYGVINSFHWSVGWVCIWNLIKSDTSPSSIRHIYYFEGKKVGDILLDIRSPLWRTWSYKTIFDKRLIGQWRVDITSVEGELLERVHFEVN
jgi:cytoskeletal protein RodZ